MNTRKLPNGATLTLLPVINGKPTITPEWVQSVTGKAQARRFVSALLKAKETK